MAASDGIRAVEVQLPNTEVLRVEADILDDNFEEVLVSTLRRKLGFPRSERAPWPGMLETPLAVKTSSGADYEMTLQVFASKLRQALQPKPAGVFSHAGRAVVTAIEWPAPVADADTGATGHARYPRPFL
jgi:hypothetical protein